MFDFDTNSKIRPMSLLIIIRIGLKGFFVKTFFTQLSGKSLMIRHIWLCAKIYSYPLSGKNYVFSDSFMQKILF